MAAMARVWKILSLPENSLRLVQLILGGLVLTFIGSWSSNGITYTDLNADDYDEKGKLVVSIIIGFFVMLYIAGVLIYLCIYYPRTLPPFLDICVSWILFTVSLISFSLLESAVSNLGKSMAVREASLSLGVLSAAVVFSLALSVLFTIGCLFAIWEYRSHRADYDFTSSRTMSDLPDDIPT